MVIEPASNPCGRLARLVLLATLLVSTGCSAMPQSSLFATFPWKRSHAAAGQSTLSPEVREVLTAARGLVGVPYRYGGTSRQTGVDCSGMLNLAFQEALGVTLPRRAVDLSKLGTPVRREQLQPGDLVFFNTLGRPFSHAGLYVGNGEFIHAASRGPERSVTVSRLDEPYYASCFQGARRLPLAGIRPS